MINNGFNAFPAVYGLTIAGQVLDLMSTRSRVKFVCKTVKCLLKDTHDPMLMMKG